jgi:hypothetical protein
MTYTEALTQIPEAAEWSSSFGNPGEGGYVEYHRTQSGERWTISNGDWLAMRPFEWTANKLNSAA